MKKSFSHVGTLEPAGGIFVLLFFCTLPYSLLVAAILIPIVVVWLVGYALCKGLQRIANYLHRE